MIHIESKLRKAQTAKDIIDPFQPGAPAWKPGEHEHLKTLQKNTRLEDKTLKEQKSNWFWNQGAPR